MNVSWLNTRIVLLAFFIFLASDAWSALSVNLYPGHESNPREMRAVQRHVLFLADTPTVKSIMHVTDGTNAGTLSLRAPSEIVVVKQLGKFAGRLWWLGRMQGEQPLRVFASDGTVGGTASVDTTGITLSEESFVRKAGENVFVFPRVRIDGVIAERPIVIDSKSLKRISADTSLLNGRTLGETVSSGLLAVNRDGALEHISLSPGSVISKTVFDESGRAIAQISCIRRIAGLTLISGRSASTGNLAIYFFSDESLTAKKISETTVDSVPCDYENFGSDWSESPYGVIAFPTSVTNEVVAFDWTLGTPTPREVLRIARNPPEAYRVQTVLGSLA